MLNVGTDIVAVRRIADALERTGALFRRRVYTSGELDLADAHPNALRFLATSFAAKEAVFKALRPPADGEWDLREIEVGRDSAGAPTVTLHGSLAAHAEAAGCRRVDLSLSWESEYAVAVALACVGRAENPGSR